MVRRLPILLLTWAALLFAGFASSPVLAADELPADAGPPALEFHHFPTRMHAFIWRNWNVVATERIARVLGTTRENVAAISLSMGLPAEDASEIARMRQRGYITLIRRNWHLLPYDQLLVLLDMTPAQLGYTLREDDFLYMKLGSIKPQCAPLKYEAPTEATLARCAEIKALIEQHFGEAMKNAAAPRFAFLKPFEKGDEAAAGFGPISNANDEGPRFIYSYFAVYGDPLLDPALDPFPDGLLQQLAAKGVNGVWLHVVLRQLAPGGKAFPEFGDQHAQRLASLRALVARAKKYGVGVYLYMNEPRAMPASFFKGREEVKGAAEGDHAALCTSTEPVRAWLSDALAFVFKNVPDLAGVFTITASENFTSCASHNLQEMCPHCKMLGGPKVIANVNRAIEEGVHRGNPDAKVIVWDWGWPDDWAQAIISDLPKNVWLQSVSEWSLPIMRGGVQTVVGEYSISAVGPGPRATSHWAMAKKAGLRTIAKVQLNNTWEISAVPYLPVMDLIAEHAHNLAGTGVEGLMLSWSLGGYPSPNLDIARRIIGQKPTPDVETVLDAVARERFGDAAAPHGRKAWKLFSDAFREFPYDSAGLYSQPASYGPSNLLFAKPTGYAATMIGFPYDDLNRWRATYPPDVFAGQFEKLANGFDAGAAELRASLGKVPAEKREAIETELRFAEAAALHFRSCADQTRFILARDALAKSATDADRDQLRQSIRLRVESEMKSAEKLFGLARGDSRIGYEASNHYYYLPQDLMEKVINCDDVSRSLSSR